MAGGQAAARAGERVAEGIIAKAAKDVLRDAEGPIARAAARDGASGAERTVLREGEDVATTAANDGFRAAAGDGGRGVSDVASHPGTAGEYEYNMVHNPGPLATDEYGRAAQNFAGGRYNARVTDEDMVLYRGGEHGKPLGQYFSRTPPVGELQTRIDNAVETIWKDGHGAYQGTSIVDTGYAVHIPKGTTIFEGPVASRGGALVGGAEDQIFIHQPWNIEGLHAIDSWPLA